MKFFLNMYILYCWCWGWHTHTPTHEGYPASKFRWAIKKKTSI